MVTIKKHFANMEIFVPNEMFDSKFLYTSSS